MCAGNEQARDEHGVLQGPADHGMVRFDRLDGTEAVALDTTVAAEGRLHRRDEPALVTGRIRVEGLKATVDHNGFLSNQDRVTELIDAAEDRYVEILESL